LVGAVGAGAAAATEVALLNAIGFTALGPAAGSYVAGWMSSIALANGVGVSAGSLFAAAQAAAMGGTALVGAPIVVGTVAACALVGAIAKAVKLCKRGGSGDAPGPDDSTEGELSADEDVTEGDEHSDEVLGQWVQQIVISKGMAMASNLVVCVHTC
jgi:hypothetical protein